MINPAYIYKAHVRSACDGDTIRVDLIWAVASS